MSNTLEKTLREAILLDDLGKIQGLLDQGANPNFEDVQGASLLFYVSATGSVEAAKLLIAKGANIHHTSASGTPLHVALVKQHADLALFLIEQGADIHRAIGLAAMTPLHLAAHFGLEKVVKKLLEKQADPNALSTPEQTPLLVAVAGIMLGNAEPSGKVIRLLLEHGADPRINPRAGMRLIEAARTKPFLAKIIREELTWLASHTKDEELKKDIVGIFEELDKPSVDTQTSQALHEASDWEDDEDEETAPPLYSSLLGELSNTEFDDWWGGKSLCVPFWDNREVAVTYIFEPEIDPNFIAEADKALSNFLKLEKKDRLAITPELFKYCNACWEATDYSGTVNNLSNEALAKRWLKNDDPHALWQYVNFPDEIYVTRRHRRDEDVYVSMGMGCEWEEEHGLHMVFRQGKRLTRLSAHDGHLTEADAYNKPDHEDQLLSAFKED